MRPIVTISGLKLWIYDLTTKGASWMQKRKNFQKIFFSSPKHLGKKLNLWVWANEALYLKFEIYDPMIRGSGPKVGSIWPFSENLLNPIRLSRLQACMFEEDLMHDYDALKPCTFPKILKFTVSGLMP